MENDLLIKLQQIKDDKDTNLKPENLKKGVTCLGVTGTLESTSGGVKLFETEEEMQADNTAKEGDLAVVYRNEVNNMTADTQTQYITFPETVTLPEAFTGSAFGMLRAVDESVMFDGNIQLDQNMFRFNGFTDTGMITVSYTSSDGITYTREEFMGNSGDLTNPVDLGTAVKYEPMEPWNDTLGYFMQVGGNTFEGLYEFNLNISTRFNKIYDLDPALWDKNKENDIETNFGYLGNIEYSTEAIFNCMKTITNDLQPGWDPSVKKFSDEVPCFIDFFMNSNKSKIYAYTNTFQTVANNGSLLEAAHAEGICYEYSINIDGTNLNKKEITKISSPILLGNRYFDINLASDIKYSLGTANISGATQVEYRIVEDGTVYDWYYASYSANNLMYVNKYILASTQLTSTADKVYNSIYYGKDGVNEGTLTQNVSNSFADINAEIYYNIQQTYNNMEPRVLTDSDKTIDKNIYFIPTKLDGTALLDTSQVTNMSNMFENCSNLIVIPLLNTNSTINMSHMFFNCDKLEIIPLLDTSNVTDMSYMFNSCTNLDNIPLLNTTKVNTMKNMFYFCRSLTNLPEFNTTNVKNMSYMLYYCENLTSIPTIDTSNVTDMSYMFYGCKNLISLPELNTTNVTTFKYTFKGCTSLTSISTLNIAKCKNFQNMFNGCTNLQNVPVYDVTVAPVDITDMFLNCPSLSDDSLNNILQTCINSDSDASSPNGYKTLKDIGLSEEQATKCTTLSNWQACVSAGWTTGY